MDEYAFHRQPPGGATSPPTGSAAGRAENSPRVEVDADLVLIERLAVEDPVLSALLRTESPEDRPAKVERVLAIGARGLTGMGIGLDVAEIDRRIGVSLDRAGADTRQQVQELLVRAQATMDAALDPHQRDSITSRILADFASVREAFVSGIDPDRADSHTNRFLGRLDGLFGADGPLAKRLDAALDPHSDGSRMGQLNDMFERRFTEIRDLLHHEKGRRVEADAGTRKGLEFEDRLDLTLRALAKPMGALVERTSLQTGELGTAAKVGDYLLVLPDGARIVVEAKNSRSISLLGSDGMLAELDRAMANRGADIAICVSALEAFPAEVGSFGIYGDRILVVDDGDGMLLGAALRWAEAAARAHGNANDFDRAFVDDRIQRIRQLGQLFSANRRSLTEIVGSVERVRTSLDGVRAEMLDLTDDLTRSIRSGSEVVEFRRQAG